MVHNKKLYTLEVNREVNAAYKKLMESLHEAQRRIIEAHNEINFDLYGAGEPMITPTGEQVEALERLGVISPEAAAEYNKEMKIERELEEKWEREHPDRF